MYTYEKGSGYLVELSKKERAEEFIKAYQKALQQEKDLSFLQQALEEKANIGLKGELHVNGQFFSLHELLGGSMEDVFKSLEDELSIFIVYLIKKNQLIQETLLSSIEWKESTPNEIQAKDESLSPQYAKEIIMGMISDYKNGDNLIPTDIFDGLTIGYQSKISISDIHELLRSYVDEEKMKVVHYASCHKCSSGYQKYYDKLPHNVICEDCGADIVNIEIHYKKLFLGVHNEFEV